MRLSFSQANWPIKSNHWRTHVNTPDQINASAVSNIMQCQITLICAIARVRSHRSLMRRSLFIYLIFISSVTVMIKVRVLGLGFNNSRKSRTVSYLAMRHIWHDAGHTWWGRELTRASTTGTSATAATERTSSEWSVRLCIITGSSVSRIDIAMS